MANLKRATDPKSVAAPPESPESGKDAVQISEEVFAAIVRRCALSVPGVVRLGSQSLGGGLAQLLGRRAQDPSIAVEFERGGVNLGVTVVIRFGEHVPTVAANITTLCRRNVENLTGQTVNRFSVIVSNLEGAEGGEAGEA